VRLSRAIPILAAIPLLIQGCGLEYLTFLNPPGTPGLASSLTPTFTVQATTANNEIEFRGFELYYKFYSDSSQIQLVPSNTLESDLRNIYGYVPICSSLDPGATTGNLHVNKPLLPVQIGDRGASFAITVNFVSLNGNIDTSQPVVTYSGATAPTQPAANDWIRRNVGDNVLGSTTYTQPKLFIRRNPSDPPTYASTDVDVQGILSIAQTSGNGLTLAIYALSYGKQDITTDIYSTPVYLGYIQNNANQ
jgi:hypothetical protein